MIVFAIQTYNFFAIPFLLLFVVGYYWAGFGTLYQEYQGRLRWLKVVGYYWAGFGTLYQEYQGRLRWLKQRNLELARQA